MTSSELDRPLRLSSLLIAAGLGVFLVAAIRGRIWSHPVGLSDL